MTVLQYNTVPAEHQPLVAEAPKNSGRVVAAAVAALASSTTAVPFAWSIAPKMTCLSTS